MHNSGLSIADGLCMADAWHGRLIGGSRRVGPNLNSARRVGPSDPTKQASGLRVPSLRPTTSWAWLVRMPLPSQFKLVGLVKSPVWYSGGFKGGANKDHAPLPPPPNHTHTHEFLYRYVWNINKQIKVGAQLEWLMYKVLYDARSSLGMLILCASLLFFTSPSLFFLFLCASPASFFTFLSFSSLTN